MIEFETEKRCCVGDWQSIAINDDASSVKEKNHHRSAVREQIGQN